MPITKKLGPTQQVIIDAIGDRIVEREALLSQWKGAERAKMRKALTRLCADNVIAYDDLDGEILYRVNMKIADGVAVIASAPTFEPPAPPFDLSDVEHPTADRKPARMVRYDPDDVKITFGGRTVSGADMLPCSERVSSKYHPADAAATVELSRAWPAVELREKIARANRLIAPLSLRSRLVRVEQPNRPAVWVTIPGRS
jgi:hypothetical protein